MPRYVIIFVSFLAFCFSSSSLDYFGFTKLEAWPRVRARYDLSVLSIADQFQWERIVSNMATTLDVQIKNRGARRVDQIGIECTTGNHRFFEAYPRSAERNEVVTVKASSHQIFAGDLPQTNQVRCTVSIVRPHERDGRTSNNARTEEVRRPQFPLPDVEITAIRHSDCPNDPQHRKCLWVNFNFRGGPILHSWNTQCSVQGRNYRGSFPRLTDFPGNSVQLRATQVVVGSISRGQWLTRCVLDIDNSLAETNEGNNTLATSVNYP